MAPQLGPLQAGDHRCSNRFRHLHARAHDSTICSKNNVDGDVVDWDRIKREFAEFRTLLEQMPAPPSEQELQTHRVRTKLDFPSSLVAQLDRDYRAYYGSKTTEERLNRLKGEIDSGGTTQLPRALGNVENCFLTIEASIATEKCSTEFVLAWGYLNQLFGRFVELMQQADEERKDFERNEKAGASSDTIVQRYWHAHWIIANSGTERKAAEFELAALCADIWQGRLLAPPGYEAAWFYTLITDELGGAIPQRGRRDDAVLKTTYGRAKLSELEAITKNKGVAPEILPPPEARRLRDPLAF
jgi:hypothetical protein